MDSTTHLGLGVSVAFAFLRFAVTAMPKPIAWAGVLAGVATIASDMLPPHLRPSTYAILLFILGVIALAAAGHVYVERIRHKAAVTRTAIRTSGTPAAPRQTIEREFTRRTPRQLLDDCATAGLSSLQASRLLEPYIGLWIEAHARAADVFADARPDHTRGYFYDSDNAELDCRFGPPWVRHLSRIRPGDRVVIRGRIEAITKTNLLLADCEIA